MLAAVEDAQSVQAASAHSCRGVSACAQAVPFVLSVSAMHPATLNVLPAASVSVAPALVGAPFEVGSMHATQVALALAVNQAWQVACVAVAEEHAVTKAAISEGAQEPSFCTGVTNGGTSELGTLARGVGQTGPEPPLLLPEPDPDELPELEPEPPPLLLPEPLPEPLLLPEPPPLPPPEPLPLPELLALPPPELLPLPEPDPPPLPPELPPLPEPFALTLASPSQACVAESRQALVSTQEAQLKVCPPTAK